MNSDEILAKAYRWISPIMQRGGEIASETAEQIAFDENMSAAVISAIQKAMNEEERVIYYCESFSAQCNMSGLSCFFNDSIALDYYEVISALESLGSEKMVQALQRCKELIFGDQDVPVGDEERLEEFLDPERPDWDEIESKLEQISEDLADERSLFESQLSQYAIACGEAGKLAGGSE